VRVAAVGPAVGAAAAGAVVAPAAGTAAVVAAAAGAVAAGALVAAAGGVACCVLRPGPHASSSGKVASAAPEPSVQRSRDRRESFESGLVVIAGFLQMGQRNFEECSADLTYADPG